jgi:sulfonate transport system substrate-binding protein
MKKSFIGIIIFLGLLVAYYSIRTSPINQSQSNSLTNIRVGWQIPWATQGQLTNVLRNTDSLKRNKLQAEFKGFSFGAPLNEAALAKEVDVIFTADQPAATLISKNSDWVIIGRLMYNRVSLYVPPQSPIKTAVDLRGKTVGMPFGAAAQRVAYQAQKDAGLNPLVDVNNVNIGIYEQSDLVRDKTAVTWGELDALAGFDPTPAIFEEKGLIRNIKVGKVVSVIVMSKSYITNHPQAPEQFLRSFIESYDYYRTHKDQADEWFIKDAKLAVSKKALQTAASVEPNLSASSKDNISIELSTDDIKALQEAADFLYEQKFILKHVTMKEHIDLSFLKNVTSE